MRLSQTLIFGLLFCQLTFGQSGNEESLKYLSVLVEYNTGRVEIDVYGEDGHRAYRYYDPKEIPRNLRNNDWSGWRRVEIVGAEDQRWEMEVINRLVREGWKLENSDFAIGIGASDAEYSISRSFRETRSRYLLSKLFVIKRVEQAIGAYTFVEEHDLDGDEVTERVMIGPVINIVGSTENNERELVIQKQDDFGWYTLVRSSTALLPYDSSTNEPDPLLDIRLENGRLILVQLLPNSKIRTQYEFGWRNSAFALNRVVFYEKDESISECDRSFQMVFTPNRTIAERKITENDCAKRYPPANNEEFKAEVPGNFNIYLNNFKVFNNQLAFVKRGKTWVRKF